MNALTRKLWLLLCLLALSGGAFAADKPPVIIGADLEISDSTSTADDAILLGMQAAIDDINARGGVLGGRKLALFKTDNRGIPARGRENVLQMVAKPDLVAVFTSKFSAIAMEEIVVANQHGLPMLDPWAAADGIVDNDASPNYVFRLSLTDSWAMQALLAQARRRGFNRLAALAPANAWGRSCLAAIDKDLSHNPGALVSVQSYYWGGEKTLAKHYQAMLDAGAQAVILIANETDGSLFVRDVAARRKEDRLPILSHWGVLTGNFIELAGPALQDVDLVTLLTRNIEPPRNAAAARLAKLGVNYFKVDNPSKIIPIAGIANAWDLTQLLALAINRAGSTNRAAIRDALEHLPPYEGVVKRYERPFTPSRHEALSPADVVLVRFGARGQLIPVDR